MSNEKRALLIIDVQNEYFTGKLPVTYPKDTLPNVLCAMDSARESDVPVVVIQHAAPQPDSTIFRKGSHEWELHADVASRRHDILIEKSLPGSFTGTKLEQWLRAHDISTLAIAGYMTQMCCDTTARQAVHMGFKVEFLSDATGTLAIKNVAGSVTDEELHRAILVTQQMRFSQVMTTEHWIESVTAKKQA